MKNKKLFPLAMAAVMGVSLFAGCGQTGESSVESVSGARQLRLAHRAVNQLKLSGWFATKSRRTLIRSWPL